MRHESTLLERARRTYGIWGHPVTTTREYFGTALASLAHLYNAAEQRGDTASAGRYSAAVNLLLDAWPPDTEQQSDRSSRPKRAVSTWPAQEQTLIGLGIVPRWSVAIARA